MVPSRDRSARFAPAAAYLFREYTDHERWDRLDKLLEEAEQAFGQWYYGRLYRVWLAASQDGMDAAVDEMERFYQDYPDSPQLDLMLLDSEFGYKACSATTLLERARDKGRSLQATLRLMRMSMDWEDYGNAHALALILQEHLPASEEVWSCYARSADAPACIDELESAELHYADDAVIVLTEDIYIFFGDGAGCSYRQEIIKVLSRSGIQSNSTYLLDFHPLLDEVEVAEVYLLKPDGSQIPGERVYDRLCFPGLEVGDACIALKTPDYRGEHFYLRHRTQGGGKTHTRSPATQHYSYPELPPSMIGSYYPPVAPAGSGASSGLHRIALLQQPKETYYIVEFEPSSERGEVRGTAIHAGFHAGYVRSLLVSESPESRKRRMRVQRVLRYAPSSTHGG